MSSAQRLLSRIVRRDKWLSSGKINKTSFFYGVFSFFFFFLKLINRINPSCLDKLDEARMIDCFFLVVRTVLNLLQPIDQDKDS